MLWTRESSQQRTIFRRENALKGVPINPRHLMSAQLGGFRVSDDVGKFGLFANLRKWRKIRTNSVTLHLRARAIIPQWNLVRELQSLMSCQLRAFIDMFSIFHEK